MLGERGLWYKMTFFEGAVRVPLIVHAPTRFTPRRIPANVSLLDLLPTLAELAGGEADPTLPGHSLLPFLHGESGHDGVYGEYLAEGALSPIVMIRRGPWKYITSLSDPEQLFNLADDPDERHNLAVLPQYQAQRDAFRQESAARWRLPELNQAVLNSQRQRLFLNGTLARGETPYWDYQPRQDASQRYIRNHQTLDEQEAQARFPQVQTTIND